MKFKVGDQVQVRKGSFFRRKGKIIGYWDDNPSTLVPYPYLVRMGDPDLWDEIYANDDELTLISHASGVATFTLFRWGNISATHDENTANPPDVAQLYGAIFPSGKTVVVWNTAAKSVSIFDSYDEFLLIHGHPEYDTQIVFS